MQHLYAPVTARRPLRYVPGVASPVCLDRLTIFTFLWGVTRLFHQLSFPATWFYTREPTGWALFLAAIWAVLRPRSVTALVTLLTFSMVRTFRWLPYQPNHILLEMMVDGGILLIVLYKTFGIRRAGVSPSDPDFREATFRTFAPYGALSLVVLYFFGVFHKLNTDYLNLDISCGTILTEGIIGKPVPYWIQIGVVYGTLVIEAAIPLLLLMPRTRLAGLSLAIFFHLILAFNPAIGIYSFSALLYAYWLFYLPPSLPGHLLRLGKSLQGRVRQWPRKMLLAGLLLTAALLGGATVYLIRQKGLFDVGFFYWNLYALAYMAVFFYLIGVQRMGRSQGWTSFRLTNPVLWVCLAVIFLNGLSPYLGLKTESSFSMFSNLRTEGGRNNHLFMPAFTQTTGWQDELVEIRDTDLEALRAFTDGQRLLTLFELRRFAGAQKGDFFVDYLLNGQPARLEVKNGRANNAALVQPYPWYLYKGVYFRPIYKEECLCQH